MECNACGRAVRLREPYEQSSSGEDVSWKCSAGSHIVCGACTVAATLRLDLGRPTPTDVQRLLSHPICALCGRSVDLLTRRDVRADAPDPFALGCTYALIFAVIGFTVAAKLAPDHDVVGGVIGGIAGLVFGIVIGWPRRPRASE